MDYIAKINGIDVLIEQQSENRENREKLFQYYSILLQKRGFAKDPEKTKSLETIVENMTETVAKGKLDLVDDRRINRFLAYKNAFEELTKEEKDIVDALEEVIEATSEDDELDSILVNGNKFLYEKGSIDIMAFTEKLYSIGEEQKGNTWMIYLDDEGELVIY